MQQEPAFEIANAWLEQSRLDPDVQRPQMEAHVKRLAGALQYLAPEPEIWTVLKPSPDVEPEIVVMAGGAFYRVRVNRADGGTGVDTQRVPLGDDVRVNVHERVAYESGAQLRHRTWLFEFGPSIDELKLEAQEILNSSLGPVRDEIFARALARATGWPID